MSDMTKEQFNKRIAADILIAALGGQSAYCLQSQEQQDQSQGQAKNIAAAYRLILAAVAGEAPASS